MVSKKIRYLLLIWLCISLVSTTLFAGKEIKYPVSDIPDSLRENSDAVVREDILKFSVVNDGNGKSYIKMVITILNQKADHFAEVSISYDPQTKIQNLNASVYNKFGVEVNQIKQKDIKDYSAYSGFYEDNRIKYMDMRYADYPFTIEYEYEVVHDGLLFYPSWVPFSAFNVSSQHSVLEIEMPEGLGLRYKEVNLPSGMVKDINANKYRWELNGYKALEKESLMPNFSEIIPVVYTAPTKFTYEGFSGNLSSWEAFGKWINTLNQGRNVLPADLATKLNTLVADAPDDYEKIRRVYEYLQTNTRYISIQLGIGGFQTFPASEVASKGYGDCKALSNFMHSMLKEINIKSYYTLVRAGSFVTDVDSDFPNQQFNHVILCVPLEQDTVWLECTSQDNPIGYQGYFTSDRNVLLVTEEGGKMARTKRYHKEENQQIQKAQVTLGSDGNAKAKIYTSCTGLQYENLDGVLDVGVEEQKKWMYKNLDIPSFEIVDFAFKQKKEVVPEVSGDIEVNLKGFGSVSGKRIFFQPNLLNRRSTLSVPQKERKYDLVLRVPYMDVDSIKFAIPEGYHLEYIPEEKTIDSKFGKYSCKIVVEEGKVIYVRQCSASRGKFLPSEYAEYVKYNNEIAEADKMKLVLVKST